jgi:hypothetical protein
VTRRRTKDLGSGNFIAGLENIREPEAAHARPESRAGGRPEKLNAPAVAHALRKNNEPAAG